MDEGRGPALPARFSRHEVFTLHGRGRDLQWRVEGNRFLSGQLIAVDEGAVGIVARPTHIPNKLAFNAAIIRTDAVFAVLDGIDSGEAVFLHLIFVQQFGHQDIV